MSESTPLGGSNGYSREENNVDELQASTTFGESLYFQSFFKSSKNRCVSSNLFCIFFDLLDPPPSNPMLSTNGVKTVGMKITRGPNLNACVRQKNITL